MPLLKARKMTNKKLLLVDLENKHKVDVSADVILTHPVGVNLTHLGNDGGFLATDNVDSGASSGDQSNGASRRQH